MTKRYLVTLEDLAEKFNWCECDNCIEDFEKGFADKEIPDWATHFAGDVEDAGGLVIAYEEIPTK